MNVIKFDFVPNRATPGVRQSFVTISVKCPRLSVPVAPAGLAARVEGGRGYKLPANNVG